MQGYNGSVWRGIMYSYIPLHSSAGQGMKERVPKGTRSWTRSFFWGTRQERKSNFSKGTRQERNSKNRGTKKGTKSFLFSFLSKEKFDKTSISCWKLTKSSIQKQFLKIVFSIFPSILAKNVNDKLVSEGGCTKGTKKGTKKKLKRNEAGTKTSLAKKERGRNENGIFGKGTWQKHVPQKWGTVHSLEVVYHDNHISLLYDNWFRA